VKVLLDENLDHRLRIHLGAHEVFTASYKGWDGFKNGKLLQAAEDDGFDVLVTGDQTLYYEQSLAGRRLAIVAPSSVEWRILKDYLSQIVNAVDSAGVSRHGHCGEDGGGVKRLAARFTRPPLQAPWLRTSGPRSCSR
jgi:hypothetical protein